MFCPWNNQQECCSKEWYSHGRHNYRIDASILQYTHIQYSYRMFSSEISMSPSSFRYFLSSTLPPYYFILPFLILSFNFFVHCTILILVFLPVLPYHFFSSFVFLPSLNFSSYALLSCNLLIFCYTDLKILMKSCIHTYVFSYTVIATKSDRFIQLYRKLSKKSK